MCFGGQMVTITPRSVPLLVCHAISAERRGGKYRTGKANSRSVWPRLFMQKQTSLFIPR
jgi:hypothetical protein